MATYPQTYLTLSAEPCNGTETAGSLTAYVRRLAQLLRLARKRGDIVAQILLEQRILRELAR